MPLNRGAVHRMGRGHQLGKAHADQIRADRLRHHDAVAGDRRGVGGGHGIGQARPVVVVFHNHRRVGGEAAGRQHHAAVGMQGDVRAFGGGGLHADHLAVFDDQLVGAGIGHDLNAVGLGRVGEDGDDVAVGQTVGARPHRTQNGGGGVVPLRADALRPLQRVQRALVAKVRGQLQIRLDDGAVQAGALAAHIGVEHVQLRRIEQGGGTAGNVVVDLALDGLQQHLGANAPKSAGSRSR